MSEVGNVYDLKHRCLRRGLDARYQDYGVVYRCDVCERPWVYIFTRRWTPVRWWHRKAKQLLAKEATSDR